MLTFQYLLGSGCSIQSLDLCIYRKNVDTSLQQSEGLVTHEELTTMAEVFKEQEMEGCSGLSSLKITMTFSLNVLLPLHILDCFRHCFQG